MQQKTLNQTFPFHHLMINPTFKGPSRVLCFAEDPNLLVHVIKSAPASSAQESIDLQTYPLTPASQSARMPPAEKTSWRLMSFHVHSRRVWCHIVKKTGL